MKIKPENGPKKNFGNFVRNFFSRVTSRITNFANNVGGIAAAPVTALVGALAGGLYRKYVKTNFSVQVGKFAAAPVTALGVLVGAGTRALYRGTQSLIRDPRRLTTLALSPIGGVMALGTALYRGIVPTAKQNSKQSAPLPDKNKEEIWNSRPFRSGSLSKLEDSVSPSITGTTTITSTRFPTG
jgi:hypothetical protein